MSLSFGYSASPDTAMNPVPTRTGITPAKINYAADWRVVSEGPGEVVLTNIKTTGDFPETLRVAFSQVADVFKGTSLSAPEGGANALSNKTGVNILVQANLVGVDEYGTYWPVQAHLVLKAPTVAMTGATLEEVVERLLGHLFETGASTPETRLNALLKGAVQPAGV